MVLCCEDRAGQHPQQHSAPSPSDCHLHLIALPCPAFDCPALPPNPCPAACPAACPPPPLQEVEYVKEEAKLVYLLECLQKTAPPVLVFGENKKDVDNIHEFLLVKGVEAVAVHGSKDQEEREWAISSLKAGGGGGGGMVVGVGNRAGGWHTGELAAPPHSTLPALPCPALPPANLPTSLPPRLPAASACGWAQVRRTS